MKRKGDIFIIPPEVNDDTDEDEGSGDEWKPLMDKFRNRIVESEKVTTRSKKRLMNKSNSAAPIKRKMIVLKTVKRKRRQNVEENEPPAKRRNIDSNKNKSLKAKSVAPRKKIIVRKNVCVKSRKKVSVQSRKKPIKQSDTTWKIEDLNETEHSPFPEANYSQYKDHTPAQLFELFFDDEIMDHIIRESTEYGLSKNWPNINLTKNELKVFFAILIVTGYNPLPSKALHWSRNESFRNEAIYKAMRRDRFDTIMKCLHFHPNTELDKGDKYSKIRPLIKHLQKKFMEHFIPSENISHDEAMIAYFGKHSCKQSIRIKPTRFGYKCWCQCIPEGYLIAFDLYQGHTYLANEDLETKFGKCSSTILHLLQQYPEHKSKLAYHVFCDNLFTSIPLLNELQTRGYNCTGTVRSNRVGQGCPLMNSAVIDKRKVRGYMQTATARTKNNKISLTRWKDNAVVTVASTLYGQSPIGTSSRWSKAEKKKVEIPTPNAIKMYNKNMGGVDRMDQNINAYRISVRGKKWWWPLFTWLVDVSVQNSWQLSRLSGNRNTQLKFRTELAMGYINDLKSPPRSTGRKPKLIPKSEARYDGLQHYVQPTEGGRRRRCAKPNCKSTIRTECQKCKVGLCVKCFVAFHNN